ncbi:hypothetical protein COTS27_00687 [Spirochaetota bacterium]|nr:hypothetical protein COTS27_00687 [Spirochaetota bacterium]
MRFMLMMNDLSVVYWVIAIIRNIIFIRSMKKWLSEYGYYLFGLLILQCLW